MVALASTQFGTKGWANSVLWIPLGAKPGTQGAHGCTEGEEKGERLVSGLSSVDDDCENEEEDKERSKPNGRGVDVMRVM